MNDRRVVVEPVPDEALVRESVTRGFGPDARDAGWAGVAVDVLRASSTLAQARANGAARILPFADTAAAIAWRHRESGALACGERDGRIVPGFDLGNSPFEYTRERVEGRTLAFASTNGSRAMLSLWGCGRRWLGAFVNASAVLRALEPFPWIWITCAGKLGEPCDEDLAFAGWLCAALKARGWRLDGERAAACSATAPRTAAEVRDRVEGSEHGRYLASLGPEFAADVRWCATLDAMDGAFEFGPPVSGAAPAAS
jgi:2-phosphosulfolactate phosphatase